MLTNEFTSEHPPRGAHQHFKNRKLFGGQRNESVAAPCLTRGGVELEVFDLQQHRRRVIGAAEQGSHARHQFAQRVRFDEVIVRAQVEPCNPILDRVARGGHQDSGGRHTGTKGGTEGVTVSVWQSDVQHDSIIWTDGREFACHLASSRRINGKTGGPQERRGALAQRVIVFDQQHTHARESSTRDDRRMNKERPLRIGVVLGGGALKGMAHVGALRALHDAGIRPSLYAGTSIGAMIAAAAACGRSIEDLTDRARRFRRRDLFRINHMGMIMERMLSRSIYLEEPLRELTEEVVQPGTFADFKTPLLVTAVDLERGTPLVYGTPGLQNVSVREAVYASCALPGFFPPGIVGNRICVDGGTTDNLPIAIAGLDMDAIIAVDVGIADVPLATGVAEQGFASIFMRAATMMMHHQQQAALDRWTTPPLLLVRPKVSHIGWFSFSHVEELLEVGYSATRDALKHLNEVLASPGGLFPRAEFEISVDKARCTGCGLCVSRHPDLMRMHRGFAEPLVSIRECSPRELAVARSCPFDAITVAAPHERDQVGDDLAQSG